MSDVLTVALRAYAIPADSEDSTETKAETKRTYPHRPSGMFIIDTETTTDPAQLLTFGSARYYVSHHRAADEWALTDEWLFYADDLAVSDAAGCALLSDRVARLRAEVSHPVHLCTRTAFVDGPFWQLAYRARAMVIGFNLPFDLSRLATHWGEGRRVRNPRDPSRMLDGQSGGFTFRMWEHDGADNLYRPRVFIKKLAPGRNLIRFTVPQRADDDDTIPDVGGHQRYSFRGHFLDLHTLAFALTTRRHSLASACETFAVEHGKIAVEEHGVITAEYIDYNRRDVEATYELALKLLAEFDRHPISPDYSGKQPGASAIKPALQATKAYSTASVGKSYLRSMGLIPVLKRQPDFPKHILGRCMAAFYGGRAECRIRNTAVPIVLLDFLSMYPTVNALMDNWRLLIAHRIEIEDATADVRALLARMSLDVVLTPETWRGFCTLVEIIPHGDRLPVRAQYGRHPGWNIGVNPVTSDRPSFYMLPDVVASVILTGLIPEIRSAVRFTAHGIQPGLHPTLLRGQISVNPRTDDLFRTAIETRKSLGNRSDMSEETRASLGQFLKIFANATGYGIFAEMLRRELAIGEHQEVDVYSDCSRFTSQTAAPESPGEYFFSTHRGQHHRGCAFDAGNSRAIGHRRGRHICPLRYGFDGNCGQQSGRHGCLPGWSASSRRWSRGSLGPLMGSDGDNPSAVRRAQSLRSEHRPR